jgi:hypothetical protein
MKLKFLAAAALLSCGLGVSAQTTTTTVLGSVDNGATPIGAFKLPGTFLDIYEFTVSNLGLAAGAVVSTPIDLPFFPGVEYGYQFAAIGLYTSSFTELAIDIDGSDGFSVQAALPSAGTYKLLVAGGTTGAFGGAYGGVLQTVVAAVPEPETYAMLLAGLGAIGLISRRRRQG